MPQAGGKQENYFEVAGRAKMAYKKDAPQRLGR
jgi:hypothetical protein